MTFKFGKMLTTLFVSQRTPKVKCFFRCDSKKNVLNEMNDLVELVCQLVKLYKRGP